MDVLLLRDENPPGWQEMPPVYGPAADAPEPLRALDVVAGAWSLHRSPGAAPPLLTTRPRSPRPIHPIGSDPRGRPAGGADLRIAG